MISYNNEKSSIDVSAHRNVELQQSLESASKQYMMVLAVVLAWNLKLWKLICLSKVYRLENVKELDKFKDYSRDESRAKSHWQPFLVVGNVGNCSYVNFKGHYASQCRIRKSSAGFSFSTPDVLWFQNALESHASHILPGSWGYKRSSTLWIKSAVMSDSGIYGCQAQNEKGVSTATVRLDVYG